MSDAHISIRAMGAEDIDRVMQIAGELATAPKWERTAYETAIAGGAVVRRIALVAEVAARVVGFTVAAVVVEVAELESIAVAELAQRQGIGEALLTTMVGELRVAGVGRLELEVRESNRTAARFYARAGFVEVGRRWGYYSDPVEDAVLLRLGLGKAAG